jgi:hypothetical protein
MTQDNQDFDLIPGQGWLGIHFSDPPEVVEEKLRLAGVPFEKSRDQLEWDFGDGDGVIYFLAGANNKPSRVAQFVMDEHVSVKGKSVVGTKLDEALYELDVRSFEDTLWSMVDIDNEYRRGVPIDDSKRLTRAEPLDLLESGTLWVKSLGLGLVLHDGRVVSLALRSPGDVPQIGCGALNKETLGRSLDEDLQHKIRERRASSVAVTKPSPDFSNKPSVFGWLKPVIAIVVFSWVAWLIFGYVQNQIAWTKATRVGGVVVRTEPEGLFPELLTVEYQLPAQDMKKVILKWNETTAREVGDEVDLYYIENKPGKVLTKMQAVDKGGDFSSEFTMMNFLIGMAVLITLYPSIFARRRHGNGRR